MVRLCEGKVISNEYHFIAEGNEIFDFFIPNCTVQFFLYGRDIASSKNK